jgi:predicted HNH restriction endonuclease
LGKNPNNNARATAQVCDLLDAAAALADVPLLALVAVRDVKGNINKKAFVKGTPEGIREKIINKSLHHEFTRADYLAIEKSLSMLKGYGNRSAWAEVKRRSGLSDDECLRRLCNSNASQENDALQENDAINDLGSDTPEKIPVSGVVYARDTRVRREVLLRAKGKCELCGKQGFLQRNAERYLEAHHIIALANDGADRTNNVIALCPEHHREAHFGMRRNELEKEMIAKLNS